MLALAGPFYTLIAISLVPTLMFQVQWQFAESLDQTVVPMVLMLVGVALNVVLNWVFIYRNLGAPQMGLTGAGVATFISRTLGVACILIWITREPGLRSAWPRNWTAGYVWERFWRLLGIGVPIAVSLLCETAACGAAAIMMGWIGATALAAHQIAITCAAFTFMIQRGLTDVIVPTAITALAYWGLALPMGYWMGMRTGAGPMGIWYGLAAGLIFAAVALNLGLREGLGRSICHVLRDKWEGGMAGRFVT